MNYKYKVISLHFTTDCNLNCPMCYRPKDIKAKNDKFFFDLIPYLATLTPQVALGGGEPFLYPEFIRTFSEKCKENNLICNVTTNGTLSTGNFLKNVEMVSASFDKYKIQSKDDIARYMKFIKECNEYTRTGCNLLMDKRMVDNKKSTLKLIKWLFDIGVERVFALYPKNWECPDILKAKELYYTLTAIFKHFYVDDLTNMILKENKYSDWKSPCHYAKDIVSISEKGYVTGCSFDTKPLLILNKPSDILKIPNIKYKERYECPYLNLK